MSNALTNLPVIIIILGTIGLAIYTYVVTQKRKRSSAQSSEKIFTDWMHAQGFTPTHLACFGGTGIAIKDGEDRVALQSRGTLRFYPLADITALRVHQTTASARPLGAAPGVVEVRQFQLYNLDISINPLADPVKILLKDEAEMQQWEQRLKAAAHL